MQRQSLLFTPPFSKPKHLVELGGPFVVEPIDVSTPKRDSERALGSGLALLA
jgi:hypothetical protein